MRVRLVPVLVLLIGSLTAAPADAAGTPGAAPAPSSSLRAVSVTRLAPRLLEVTFATPLVVAPLPAPRVRILLPSRYDPSTGVLHPVLYLLHGAGDTAASWTSNNDGRPQSLEQFTADKDVVLVMPDGGRDARAGWYSDWFNDGTFGSPAWESFHLAMLIPWVEDNFAVRRDPQGRAIAGLSMGGFGAMSYAARHPGLFGAALSFSGALDTAAIPFLEAAGFDAVHSRFGTPTSSVWGTWEAQEVRWRAHNPADLAAWTPHDNPGASLSNLKGTVLWMTTGMGLPGGPAPDDRDPSGLAVEAFIFSLNQLFHAALVRAGVAHTFLPYPQGGHNWWHWQDDLRRAWPVIAGLFASAPSPPATVDAASAENSFGAWGWWLTAHRSAIEFLDLESAGPQGLTLSGSGTVDVRTPPLFVPGGRYALRATGPTASVSPGVAVAGGDGRLAFRVRLGGSHAVQELTALGRLLSLVPGYWETAVVGITGIGGGIGGAM